MQSREHMFLHSKLLEEDLMRTGRILPFNLRKIDSCSLQSMDLAREGTDQVLGDSETSFTERQSWALHVRPRSAGDTFLGRDCGNVRKMTTA